MAVPNSEAVQWLPSGSTSAESRSGRIGPIILEAKQTGERCARNPHAAFDEAGAGNVARPRWCDTRRRKSEPTGNTNFGLRTSATLTAAIGNCSRADGVVPFRMERVTLNVERLHLGVADLDALFVSARVQRVLDFQAGLGCRRRDQLDDSHAIRERPAAPGLRDVAEQAVLDPVPLCAAETCEERSNAPESYG